MEDYLQFTVFTVLSKMLMSIFKSKAFPKITSYTYFLGSDIAFTGENIGPISFLVNSELMV